MPILFFLGLSVLDLGPMYATDVRQTDVRQKHRLMPSLLGSGHNDTCKAGHWRQRAEERLGIPPKGNQEPLVVKDKVT